MSKYMEILAQIEELAVSEYLRYSGLCKRTECLGWEAKVKSGRFGGDELKAHKNAQEAYGKHLAFSEVAAMLREFSSDHVTAQQQAEITRLNARVAELERELDVLSESHATCGKPECTPTKVCELFFNGCRS